VNETMKEEEGGGEIEEKEDEGGGERNKRHK
jgi:hypothetical protein